MATIKSEILSMKFIKPSSPTPSHLKSHKLSLLDQLSSPLHSNLTLFFSSDTRFAEDNSIISKSHLLQAALSKTLSIFHPFAGRLVDGSTVDCDDQGAFFIEARIGSILSKFLSAPDLELVDVLLPTTDPDTMELAKHALLLVQLTGFTCGGFALSLCTSHKIADMASLNIFLHCWSAIARDSEPCVPEWIGSRLLPPGDGLPSISSSLGIPTGKFVERRFVFSTAKITQLRSKSMESGKLKHHPSRVEVVLALIWKCAMASYRRKTGSFKPSVMFQVVNLRKRIRPPLPDAIMGNFILSFMVVVREELELEIPELVAKLRNGLEDFCDDKAENLVGEEGFKVVLQSLKERMELLKNKEDMNVYRCSAWCKFPLYETDFGWGEPVWHVCVNRMFSNVISMADTRSGEGIEVQLTLEEEEMAFFERNQELLEFACPNPSIPSQEI